MYASKTLQNARFSVYKSKSVKLLKRLKTPFVIKNSDSDLKQLLKKCANDYVKDCETLNRHERLETRNKERSLGYKIPIDESELRGLALYGLTLDASFWRFVGDGELDVRLENADFPFRESLTSYGFRQGKLVHLVLLKDDDAGFHTPLAQIEGWRIVDGGVILGMHDKSAFVRISSVGRNFLGTHLGSDKGGGNPIRVGLVAKSEMNIFDGVEKALKGYYNCAAIGSAASEIIKSIYAEEFSLIRPHDDDDDERSKGEQKSNNKRAEKFDGLDAFQSEAVNQAINLSNKRSVQVIHGPPGTGKTRTLAFAVVNLVRKKGCKVLVVAPSHAACDAVTLAMSNIKTKDENLLRIGHPLRLTNAKVKPFLPQNDFNKRSEKMRNLEKRLKTVWSDMFDGHGNKDLDGREAELLAEIRRERIKLENEAILEADIVVVTTLSSVTKQSIMRLVASGHFEVVAIDEAGFAAESQQLPLILRADKLILAGDHLQLPPVITSQKGKELGFDVSLLERTAYSMPHSVSLLETQYRSNSAISAWSSAYFYGNKVKADSSVGGKLLTDLNGVQLVKGLTDSPMLFVDTAGCGFHETLNPLANGAQQEESVSNEDEAIIVEQMLLKMINAGVNPSVIGLITPYWAQVVELRRAIWLGHGLKDVEIRTVDGYQGREKELVVISLVRSNPRREIGFLEETRRINVSVTRAKKCCVIIGDSQTLSSSKGLSSLFKFCKDHNFVVSVEEIIAD